MNKDQIDALFKPNTFIRVKGILYKASREMAQDSDLVIDTRDGCHAQVDIIIGNYCALIGTDSTEMRVPVNKLIVLESLNVSDIQASELYIIG